MKKNIILASEIEKQMCFQLDRDVFEDLFLEYLELMSFLNDYGYSQKFYEGFENDIFYIKSYHWGGCTCEISDEKGLDVMTSPDKHDHECLIYKPNFIYKPSNFLLSWYKHPLRGNYCNQELTITKFNNIMKHCYQSLISKAVNGDKK